VYNDPFSFLRSFLYRASVLGVEEFVAGD